jgi:hypothetical protein
MIGDYAPVFKQYIGKKLIMTFYSDDLYNGYHIETVNELTGYRECKLFKTKAARKAYITKTCNITKRIYGF